MRMRRRSGAAGCSAACSAEVGTVVSEQLRAYLTAAALGAAAGAVYDLLRLVRLRRRRDRRLTHGLDAAFLLLVAPALLWYALRVGQGELRLIMLTAMGLGAAVYLLALSPLMRPLWDFWLSAAASTGRLLWLPVKKFTAAAKKAFIFCRKCVMIRKKRAAEKEAERHAERAGARKEAPDKSHIAAGHSRSGGGVELIRVGKRLNEAAQQQAALERQLQQQTQENQALESDLAKKDDEEFIKDLARDQLGLAEAGERIFYDVND